MDARRESKKDSKKGFKTMLSLRKKDAGGAGSGALEACSLDPSTSRYNGSRESSAGATASAAASSHNGGSRLSQDGSLSHLSSEKIDELFESMLEDMNLSAEKRAPLLVKPLEFKLNMLASSKYGTTKTIASPVQYCKDLRNAKLSSEKEISKTLESLRIALLNGRVSWVKEFNNKENDGLNLLLEFLAPTQNTMITYLSLKCIRALGNCGYGLYALVDHETASTFIARCLNIHEIPLMECALELLSTMAMCSLKGHQKVLEGLTFSAELAAYPSPRFEPLVNGLTVLELACACLQLVNVIVSARFLSEETIELDYRIHLRLEFSKLGLAQRLCELEKSDDPNIANHVAIYRSFAEADTDELFERFEVAKADLNEPRQVFQLLERSLANTSSEKSFLSILQHLLFVREEPYREHYYNLINELVSQVVLQTDGVDIDPSLGLLRLDIEGTVNALMDAYKQSDGGSSVKANELQKKLDQALQEKQEVEATLEQLRNLPPPPPLTVPRPPGAPPPPLSGLNAAPPPLPYGMKAKPVYKPKVPTKKANWDKVNEKDLAEDSVWVKMEENELASDDLLQLLADNFNTKPPKKFTENGEDVMSGAEENSGRVGAAVGAASALARKAKQIRCLDGKSAQALSILLGSLKVPYDELRRRIIEVDEALLTPNIVEQLLKALPEPEVIKQVVDMSADYSELAEPEQFICKVGTIKKLIPRLKSILFKLRFQEKVDDTKPEIVAVIEALKELRQSKHLVRVIELILLFGNYLNAGSRNAQSVGFHLSFLPKLTDTKDVIGKTTLLHFLIRSIEKKFPDTVLGLDDDLTYIERASHFSEDTTGAAIAEMKRSAVALENDLRTYTSDDSNDVYPTVMKQFLAEAQQQIEVLENMFKRMQERFKEVARYFAFDPTKYNMENMFSDLQKFITAYKQATTDIQQQREFEEKQKRLIEERQKREEEKARLRAAGLSGSSVTRKPTEEDGNVIDTLMESLKSGAAFGPGSSGGHQRRVRNRPVPPNANMSPAAVALRQNLVRQRSRRFTRPVDA
ncbi:hypothetical protein TSMEX_004710 [Taenia solium]|eukprot:TsM_000644000 transcript=TsM_000644000 gene=TsM_000644000